MALSPYQQEVLYGSLLGDGHLEAYTGPKGTTYRYILVQSTTKPVYIYWVASVFHEYRSNTLYTRYYQTHAGVKSTYRLCTRRHVDFTPFGQDFYPNGKKRIPPRAHVWLTPRVLAVWYMEDGGIKSRESKGVYLHTQGFTVHDVEYMCDIIHTVYDIRCWPCPDRSGYRIYISGAIYTRLGNLIVPYFTPDIRYKWPHPRVTHLPKE